MSEGVTDMHPALATLPIVDMYCFKKCVCIYIYVYVYMYFVYVYIYIYNVFGYLFII